MKAPWALLLALLLSLGLMAGAVFGLGDRSVLVPPPEAVVESFVRKLSPGRYPLALDHLSSPLRPQTSASALRRSTEALEARIGPIRDVRGEPGTMGANQAEADAVLALAEGRTARLRFRLTREQGLWRIHELGALATHDGS